MIYVVGLGIGGALPDNAQSALRRAKRVIVLNPEHPSTFLVAAMGIDFEVPEDPDSIELPEQLAALSDEDVLIVVPGHPLIGQPVISALRKVAQVKILGGDSGIEAILEAVGADASDGLQMIDAESNVWPNPVLPCIIYNLPGRNLQARLLWRYGEKVPTYLVNPATGETERLFNLEEGLSPHLALFLPAVELPSNYAFADLVEIVAQLRAPDGCPWDREQTHESLRACLLEETYEALDAIDRDDPKALSEELGDVLLQVLLHSQIAQENGRFDLSNVISAISEKLIRRHPHVFGDVKAETSAQVLVNWEAIKRSEKKDAMRGILADIPNAMPSLMRAFEVSKKAAKAGFEWESIEGVMDKLREEEAELQEAIRSQDPKLIEAEIGDLLFTVVNVARHAGVQPEESLRSMVARFIDRFEAMEQAATSDGKSLGDLTPDEWEAYWAAAKASQSS